MTSEYVKVKRLTIAEILEEMKQIETKLEELSK
jgi:hypothetical protein